MNHRLEYCVFLIAFFALFVGCSEKRQRESGSKVNRPKASSFQEMVKIPAGYFLMSSYSNRPLRKVFVKEFYTDKYEVTNKKYKEFMEATGHKPPEYWNDPRFNQPDYPVVGVTYYDAKAYCTWEGKRLPTVEEWEKAARGGLEGGNYPWGDTIDTTMACYGRNFKTDHPAKVGSYPANGYGLYDMAGNVWEWCNHLCISKKFLFFKEKHTDVRGGSWWEEGRYLKLKPIFISRPSIGNCDLGFRCVKDPD